MISFEFKDMTCGHFARPDCRQMPGANNARLR